MLHCNHNVDHKNLNPYHLETDCWSHTMMVCKIAETQGYDKVVQISALLHDVGKSGSRKVNPINNHVRFFGHERLSTEISREILKCMVLEEIITVDEMNDILKLISYHGDVYNQDKKFMYALFNNDKRLYDLRIQLNYCDDLGRFSLHSNK